MASDAHYSPVMGGHDVQDSEEFEFHDVTTRPSEEVEQEGTWLRCALIFVIKVRGR